MSIWHEAIGPDPLAPRTGSTTRRLPETARQFYASIRAGAFLGYKPASGWWHGEKKSESAVTRAIRRKGAVCY